MRHSHVFRAVVVCALCAVSVKVLFFHALDGIHPHIRPTLSQPNLNDGTEDSDASVRRGHEGSGAFEGRFIWPQWAAVRSEVSLPAIDFRSPDTKCQLVVKQYCLSLSSNQPAMLYIT